jgi:hypothetical protein
VCQVRGYLPGDRPGQAGRNILRNQAVQTIHAASPVPNTFAVAKFLLFLFSLYDGQSLGILYSMYGYLTTCGQNSNIIFLQFSRNNVILITLIIGNHIDMSNLHDLILPILLTEKLRECCFQ